MLLLKRNEQRFRYPVQEGIEKAMNMAKIIHLVQYYVQYHIQFYRKRKMGE